MANRWYYKVDAEVVGPVDDRALDKAAKAGELLPTTPLRFGEHGQWAAASKLTGLFANARTSSSAVPPQPSPIRPPTSPTSPKQLQSAFLDRARAAADRLLTVADNMTTRQWLFVGLIIVVLFSLFSSNEKKTKYELVNRRGQMFRVYVPPERAHDQTAYEQAIRDIGRSESIYAVLFWNDRSKIPPASQVEMTDEQLDAQVAHYNRNTTTGYNMFGWIKNSDLVEVGPVQ